MADLIDALEITALTHGGRGIGRHNGKAVFVPMTAPGDKILCRTLREKKNFVEAELVEVINPSPFRRIAPCPYFGHCGGCQWQHLPYKQQLHWKEQILSDQLVRNGITKVDKFLPIVPSADEWRYRNRVQFKCYEANGCLAIGFFRHGSHFVIDVNDCMLLTPQIKDVYKELRQELADCPHPGAVPQVDVAVGDDGTVRIVLHVLSASRDKMREWLKLFAARHEINACLQSGRKESLELVYGAPGLQVLVDRPVLSLHYGPGGFVQVNSLQNRQMVHEMLKLLDLQGDETLLDLFCGMGNFSLPLARKARRVVGVEDYAPSIEFARRNAGDNDIDNAEFHVGDAAKFVTRFQPGEIAVVVLDPPRTGSYATVKSLLTLQPNKILYVSCDPATLARDLKPLVHNGYEVVAARPYDLFPQTWHIESMTLLQRLESERQVRA